MAEEKNIYEIGTVPLLDIYELVAIPSLIKVQVIKKKIVDQMPSVPPQKLTDQGDKTVRILGRVGPYIVVHTDSQQFSKIHSNDYVDHIQGILVESMPKVPKPDYKKIVEEAYKHFYNLPQMFEG